jgi:hypothetical protein
MSKAVLVMDEMPECCADCELADDDSSGLYCVPADEYYDGKESTEDRASFCPLRELPEKIPELKSGYEDISTSIRRVGWNACLDEILK